MYVAQEYQILLRYVHVHPVYTYMYMYVIECMYESSYHIYNHIVSSIV